MAYAMAMPLGNGSGGGNGDGDGNRDEYGDDGSKDSNPGSWESFSFCPACGHLCEFEKNAVFSRSVWKYSYEYS